MTASTREQSDAAVSLETLPAMTVASCRVISKSPERDTWTRLRAWAGPRGFLGDLAAHPVFGFNNPNPVEGRAAYGYECWVAVPEDTAADDKAIEIKRFPGGAYATTQCRLQGELGMAEGWQRLITWIDAHGHCWRETHELERPHDPDAPEDELVFTLYVPIEPPDAGTAEKSAVREDRA